MSDYIPETNNNNLEDNTITVDVTAEEVIKDKKSDSRIKIAFDELLNAIKEEKLFPFLQHISTRVKTELSNLDSKWNNQYGERYQNLKQHLNTVKTRYTEEKSKVEAEGTTPIDREQTKWENKASNFAAYVAQKEQEIKDRLLRKWQKN